METEIWKDIPGFVGFYQISSCQRVKSLRRIVIRKDDSHQTFQEKILATGHDPDGYVRVKLHKPGIIETKKIHRLVAIAFIPNPDNKPFVNHINGIKDDNRIENLEWSSESENNHHAYATGLKSNAMEKGSNARIVLNLQTGIYYMCAKEAAQTINILPATFTRMLSGVRKNKTSFIYAD